MALYEVIKGGIPCMTTSPGRARTHRPEQEQEHAHGCASFGLWKSSAVLHRTFVFDYKINNVTKELYFFGCQGKITLFSFLKNPALKEFMSMSQLACS